MKNETMPILSGLKSDLNQYMHVVCISGGMFFLISFRFFSLVHCDSEWLQFINDIQLQCADESTTFFMYYVTFGESWENCVYLCTYEYQNFLHSFPFTFVAVVVHFFPITLLRGKKIQTANCQQIEYVIWFSLILHSISVRYLFPPFSFNENWEKNDWKFVYQIILNAVNGFFSIHFIKINNFAKKWHKFNENVIIIRR